ncbi:MAG: glucan biosynthesis protein [Prosthecobacter sp.]|jgi:glucans biosynthesis protein|uniref:glucan biosynthesis protein n=1 Tax=Prosthecobacter sp. TaxID=1965333 RepID=UPI001A0A5BC4|nr:glucan biosynthesis protein [Prosthecobacter sp.]MBE2286663.1 glucan biosynthesis protein [Prosthecobacter sp.]
MKLPLPLSVLSLLASPALSQVALDSVKSFSDLEKVAAQLATQPYQAPSQQLDPFFEGLKYDGHRQIRFLRDKALFADLGDTYRIEFFHPGWMFKKPVVFYNMQATKTVDVPFDRSHFEYGELKVPADAKNPVGYAGFRVLAPDSLVKRPFEFMVFMGASYYRAVTTELGYGISARGVAVNTIGGEPEEFPDFTHFWFQQPKPGDKSFKLLALLNGPSITGAYEFESMPGVTTEMKIKATLHLRKPVKMLGIAPFSSMFWFGENSSPKPYDFRPEVHDSDGLQIEIEGGPSIWRPLDVSRDLRLSIFETDRLKGFGLAERDRDFNNFQDLEAAYHRRPAVWVEPVSGFGKGAVTLVELSTGEETWDNIVAMWKPDQLPATPAEPLKVEYKLNWLDQHEPGKLCKVISSRRGFVMDSDDHLYVIDFQQREVRFNPFDQKRTQPPDIDVVLSGGEGKVVDKRVMLNTETGGWRAFFKLDIPEKTNLLEIMMELKTGKEVISERWMYQWRR